MKNVTIRRCPSCASIGSYADQLVSALRTDPDVDVRVIDGAKGELSVQVDGRNVRVQSGDSFRDSLDVAAEVRGLESVGVGA